MSTHSLVSKLWKSSGTITDDSSSDTGKRNDGNINDTSTSSTSSVTRTCGSIAESTTTSTTAKE
jgi:hypothetical protein